MHAMLVLVLCVQAYLVLGDDCSPNPCSTDETCCKGPFPGTYGCCPVASAVCCSDGLHCCPANTVCNLQAGTCDNKTSELVPFPFPKRQEISEHKMKAVAVKEAQRVNVVYCPGGLSYCPDSTTCCLLPTGQYGCCPYPSAVCCRDGYHCCPYGSRCDTTSSYCLQGNSYWPVAPKRQRMPAMTFY